MSDQHEIARIVISIQQPGEGLDPDVTTRFEYDPPHQLDGSQRPQEAVERSIAPASAVAITAQNATDQRTEIKTSSARNRALVKVDEHLGNANSRYSLAELGRSGVRKDVDLEALEGSAQNFENSAKRELQVACGNCALVDTCQISNNFSKWARVHNPSTKRKQKSADQEPREAWRRRLIADPDAPCLPPKAPKSK